MQVVGFRNVTPNITPTSSLYRNNSEFYFFAIQILQIWHKNYEIRAHIAIDIAIRKLFYYAS